MRRRLIALAALLVLPVAPAAAQHAHDSIDPGPVVPIYNASFAVPHLDVLVGDTVTWRNVSLRIHNVSADDHSFTSPGLMMNATFEHRFDTPGDVPYYCRLHPTMRGDVDVHRLLLDPAKDPAAPGRPYALTGRAALPQGATVSIQADGVEQTTATVGADGAFTATVTPTSTVTYTAVAGADSAPPVQVLVLDRKVSATQQVGKRTLTITGKVTPPTSGATVVLQLKLKEHFGWWPVKVARTNVDGTVRFTLRRGRKVQARVLLTAADEATQLARSGTLRLR